MNSLAIGFLTKDRCQLTRRSIEPLLRKDIDVWWFDGSNTSKGEGLLADYPVHKKFANVRGGADAAIVCALTHMLDANYDYIGLCENDVLLADDWLEPTMDLFVKGAQDGLYVGAVSARCYDDRILFQSNGYAVMHNLGAGMVIFTRAAARTVLQFYRTSWTTENRLVFAQLAGHDIGCYWAFRASENFITADWGFDRALAGVGLCSLALTPARVQMIGQEPSLEEQGLRLVTEPVEALRDDRRLAAFAQRQTLIRLRDIHLAAATVMLKDPGGSVMVFAHQLGYLSSDIDLSAWRLKWSQAFGPFAFRADDTAQLKVTVSGPVDFLVSGGVSGAKVQIVDTESGFEISPMMPAEDGQQLPQLFVPGGLCQRELVLTCEPGAVFYGLRLALPQPIHLDYVFDYNNLPPV